MISRHFLIFVPPDKGACSQEESGAQLVVFMVYWMIWVSGGR